MDLDFDAFQPDDSVSPIPQVLALTKLPFRNSRFPKMCFQMRVQGWRVMGYPHGSDPQYFVILSFKGPANHTTPGGMSWDL